MPADRSRARLLVLLSCGWSVRNYVRGGVLRQIEGDFDITVLVPPGDPAFEQELRTAGYTVEILHHQQLPPRLSALNFVITYAENMRHGLWHVSFWRWMMSLQPLAKRPYMESLRAAAWIVSRTRLLEAASRRRVRLLRETPAVESAKATITRLSPDLILATNPYHVEQIAFGLAAETLGVRSIASILSWDNLAYKGLPIARFTRYMVWSEFMAEQLARDGSVTRGQIDVTGSPQFDFHVLPACRWTREKFFAHVGGTPDRPLISYSAGPPQSLPEEPELVGMIWQAIQRGEIPGNPQLLVRVHPHEYGDRFERLRERCPGILISRPWQTVPAHDVHWFAPRMDDLALLTNTLLYSDAAVSAFSTVALDAMIVDRPAVCVAFSTRPDGAAGTYLRHSPEFGHCRHLADTRSVRIARSRDELIDAVTSAMRHPGADRDKRRAAVDRLCGPVDGATAQRVAAAILAAAGRARSTEEPVPLGATR